MIEIRAYCSNNCREMAALFYQTVHSINPLEYTAEQLNAWAPALPDVPVWNASFLKNDTLVAWERNRIVGFADMDATGYLDRLFVHKDRQRCGIATMLCQQLESRTTSEMVTTQASITAKPFFEKRGYVVVQEQHVERAGILLKNYVMKKE